MRAPLVRPSRTARGRLYAPVAIAAAVALVGGVVVAGPDAPTVRDDVQATSLAGGISFNAGVAETFDLRAAASAGANAGIVITGVEGLPEGMTYDAETGIVSGTAAASGVYEVIVNGTVNGAPVSVPVTVTVNTVDGTPPEGAQAGSAAQLQGSLGGEAGGQVEGQITTGSEGADTILGAVTGLVTALTGDSGSVGDLVAGSTGTGTGEVPGEGETAPAGPLGSLTDGQLTLDSLSSGGATPTSPAPESPAPETPAPESPAPEAPAPEAPGSEVGSVEAPGSTVTGETTGETTGGITTESLGPLGSLAATPLLTTGSTGTTTGEGTGETTGGGEITIPGSTTTADSGSLADLAPGLAITGGLLLGVAGLSLLLNGGSSTPGLTATLPALPGSTATGAAAPTVAAGAPAPGPTVANGRG